MDNDIIELGEGYIEDEHWKKVANGDIVSFDTPKDLFDCAIKYFAWCDEHPIQIKRKVAVGAAAGATMVEERIRPYTLDGLCLHLGIDDSYLEDLITNNDRNSLWHIVANRIDKIVKTQIVEMSIIGEYNANVAMRIMDKSVSDKGNANKVTIEVVQGLPQLGNSELDILENDLTK